MIEEPDTDAAAASDIGAVLEEFLLNTHHLAALFSDNDVFAALDLSLSEWAILKYLDRNEPLSHSKLCWRTGLSRRRADVLLYRLEGKGLVKIGHSMGQTKKGEKRLRSVTMSDRAAEILSAISNEITSIAGEVGEQRAKLVPGATKISRRIATVIKVRANTDGEE
jgi:DNA-binding MarR family transcriptional regulator